MPAQTRAFLFCDLRGYSAFTEAHGDRAARDLLGQFRQSVRDVIGTFEGSEIRTEGDSFYVVFGSVSNAVEAGLAILAQLNARSAEQPDRPLRAGVGIHAGEAEDSDEGIVSTAVNIAARICSVAEPGQLLVSDTVRALTRGYLEVGFTAHGERRLKGIAEPIRLFRVTPTPSATRASPPKVRSRLAVGIIGTLAIVVGVALFGSALLNLGTARGGPTHEPSASSPTSASPAATRASAGPGGFPNEAETALLTRLPDSLTQECFRADPDEVPLFQSGIDDPIPLPIDAGLRCNLPGGMNAFYYATVPAPPPALRSAVPETTLFGYAGRRGIREGSCEDDGPAVDRWSFGPAEGYVLCGSDVFWTYDGTNILGRVNGGRDASVTMDWWRENARFPVE